MPEIQRARAYQRPVSLRLSLRARASLTHLSARRIDIALAMGADGVHVGQSDMPAALVRRLLPAGALLGVSVNTPAEARAAVADGADYVGIGPVWSTLTKTDIRHVLGVRGVGEVLDALSGSDVKAVGIGRLVPAACLSGTLNVFCKTCIRFARI